MAARSAGWQALVGTRAGKTAAPTVLAGPFICGACIDPATGGVALAALCADNRVIDGRVEYTLEDRAYGPRASRQVLPMASGVPIQPGQSAQITARPQRVAFRPERVFIAAAGTSDGAADWIVNDITIGNRSQFAQAGGLPGDLFAAGTIDTFVSFETVQTAMDLTMTVTYNGSNPDGAPFYGSVIGTAVDGADVPITRKHVLMRIDGVIYDFDVNVNASYPSRPVIVRALWPTEIPGTPGSDGIAQCADALLELFPPRVIALRMHEEIMWGVDEAIYRTVLEIGCAVTRTERAIPIYADDYGDQDYAYADDDAAPVPRETRIEIREHRALSNRWDLAGFELSWITKAAREA